MSTAPLAAAPGRAVELSIGGMTYASCAARVEKKLNKLNGVTASVDYATETAKVRFPESLFVVSDSLRLRRFDPEARPGTAAA